MGSLREQVRKHASWNTGARAWPELQQHQRDIEQVHTAIPVHVGESARISELEQHEVDITEVDRLGEVQIPAAPLAGIKGAVLVGIQLWREADLRGIDDAVVVTVIDWRLGGAEGRERQDQAQGQQWSRPVRECGDAEQPARIRAQV